jgi:membrane protease YdiL (CAAX protease family)
MQREPGFVRDLVELILGYGLIVGVIWTPESAQRLCSPVVFVVTLSVVLARRPDRDQLGIGLRGLFPSLWILPAAAALALMSAAVAKHFGTLHALYKGDLKHVAGYLLWTLYQQFLLNNYFMPRLGRTLGSASLAVGIAGILFAAAHLPNPVLTIATLVWGVVSCALFLRYRNLYMLGLAQALLGLCIAVCVPDALHHHLRVGLGYTRYGGAAGK